MGETGCYCTHIYCDHPECRDNPLRYLNEPAEYIGSNQGDVRRQARADGWLISRTKRSEDGGARALCPRHSGKKVQQ